MRFKGTPVFELDLMSMSSSSMSGYDIDVENVEIELRRDRFLVENYPHIVVGSVIDDSDSWEHNERLHNYSDIFVYRILVVLSNTKKVETYLQ